MMEIGLTKREINRRRWLERIESWKHSGLTQKALCRQHGLELASFRRWRAIAMPDSFLATSFKIASPDDTEKTSYLAVRGQNGHFVKIRASGKDAVRLSQKVNEFLNELLSIIESNEAATYWIDRILK